MIVKLVLSVWGKQHQHVDLFFTGNNPMTKTVLARSVGATTIYLLTNCSCKSGRTGYFVSCIPTDQNSLVPGVEYVVDQWDEEAINQLRQR